MNAIISEGSSMFGFILFFIFGCVQLGYFINYIGDNNVCQSTTIWLGIDSLCWLAYSTVIMFIDLMIITIANCEAYGNQIKFVTHFVSMLVKILLVSIGTTLQLKCKKLDVWDYNIMITMSLVAEYLFVFCLLMTFVVRTCKK